MEAEGKEREGREEEGKGEGRRGEGGRGRGAGNGKRKEGKGEGRKGRKRGNGETRHTNPNLLPAPLVASELDWDCSRPNSSNYFFFFAMSVASHPQ